MEFGNSVLSDDRVDVRTRRHNAGPRLENGHDP